MYIYIYMYIYHLHSVLASVLEAAPAEALHVRAPQ